MECLKCKTPMPVENIMPNGDTKCPNPKCGKVWTFLEVLSGRVRA